MSLRIGTIYRAANPPDSDPPRLDGHPNFFHHTDTPGSAKLILGRGIFGARPIKLSGGGSRRPVIALSNSISSSGTSRNPWLDDLHSAESQINYSGDNRDPAKDPFDAQGNSMLLQEHSFISSADRGMRMKATPVISFERVKVASKIKGYLKFLGFGFVARAEQLTEFPAHGPSFENFRFQLRFLQPHSETLLDWEWISARRNPILSDEDCLRLAPLSWQTGVQDGFY